MKYEIGIQYSKKEEYRKIWQRISRKKNHVNMAQFSEKKVTKTEKNYEIII